MIEEDNSILIIHSSEKFTESFQEELTKNTNNTSIFEKNSFDGSPELWVLSAVIANQLIKSIKEIIIKNIDVNKTKYLKIGDFEIINPQENDLLKILDINNKEKNKSGK